MVWFYGGGFQEGESTEYPAFNLTALTDTIIVTVNYRVTVLGFMMLPELLPPGSNAGTNWGLLDQRQALRWVQKNIQAFGGDPKSVTIFG